MNYNDLKTEVIIEQTSLKNIDLLNKLDRKNTRILNEILGFQIPKLSYEVKTNPNSENINFYWSNEYFKQKLLLNAWAKSYVISSIDTKNKYTERLANCTSLIAIWTDNNWEAVSFITHQNPCFIFNSRKNKNLFIQNLGNRLQTLKNICIPWSIKIYISWWNIISKKYKISNKQEFENNYINSIRLLNQITKSILWFRPQIVHLPKLDSWANNIYLDTQKNMLIILIWEENIYENSLLPFTYKDILRAQKTRKEAQNN